MTHFNIEIVSDTVCPWCFVGKQKLDKAILSYKNAHPDSGDTFSTTWMPFYLVPGAPKTGIDKATYYKQKFGEDRTAMMFSRLSRVGADAGINFKFGGRTGNTRDSHRLIQLGKTKSPALQTRVVEELFASYFEQERDITSHETLLRAGTRAGLVEEEVKEWLASGKGGEEVDTEVEMAQKNRVSGVPNFTVQGRYEIGGAQEPAVFLSLFEKIKQEEVARAKA